MTSSFKVTRPCQRAFVFHLLLTLSTSTSSSSSSSSSSVQATSPLSTPTVLRYQKRFQHTASPFTYSRSKAIGAQRSSLLFSPPQFSSERRRPLDAPYTPRKWRSVFSPSNYPRLRIHASRVHRLLHFFGPGVVGVGKWMDVWVGLEMGWGDC